MSTSPDVTDRCAVIVVPRERVSTIRTCLEHLYAYTKPPFRVLVVNPGSTPVTSRELERLAARLPNCEVITAERFLLPYEAYNLAVSRLDPEDRWVAFVDNDVKVSPDWLGWLLRAAEETGARAIHPLYLFEQLGRTAVHMAQGRYHEVGNGRLRPVMELCGAELSTAAGLVRCEDDFFEAHTFLLRRDLLDEILPFADVCLGEDHEICLAFRARNERVVFEPRAVATYMADPVRLAEDRAYFRFRWYSPQAPLSVARLRSRWPIVDEYWDEKLAWLKRHQRVGARWFRPAVLAKRWAERTLGASLGVAERAARRASARARSK